MTPFQKAMHKLGYKPAKGWNEEIEAIAFEAMRALGRERVEWIASADRDFTFGDPENFADDDQDTRPILKLTTDPVIRAAYGWHDKGHISAIYLPDDASEEIRAAHVWYQLRTLQQTYEEEMKYGLRPYP